jgi:hypothetical protein
MKRRMTQEHVSNVFIYQEYHLAQEYIHDNEQLFTNKSMVTWNKGHHL